MYKTRITESPEKQLKNPNMTEVISTVEIKTPKEGLNIVQIINRVTFTGLSITSVVIFCMAIASLML